MSELLGKTEDIVKKSKELGADEVIAQTIVGKYRQVRFSNNQVDTTLAWNDYSTDIALCWKKRLVVTRVHDFHGVEPAIRNLLKLAKASKENPTFAGFAEGKFHYSKSRADEKLRDLPDMADYVFEAVNAAEKEGGSTVDSGGILFTKFEDVYLASSEGPLGIDARSGIELSIRTFAEREASGHGVECSSTLKRFKPARAGAKAGMIAKLAKNPKAGHEGVYDAVFDPLILGSLLGVWAGMVSAYSVLIQRSVFAKKLGQKVAPEIVSLKDNPSAYSLSNRVFDDEGVPTRENIFIDHGVLKTFLHNTSTAKMFKTKTTGNAGIVAPTAWNVEMNTGEASKNEILAEMKSGLYLTNTWYTRFQNYAKGDFSTIPRDGIFLIENGEIKQSLKDLRISDNVANLLSNITVVSKERQQVHWWNEADPPSLAPYVLIKRVHITKSK